MVRLRDIVLPLCLLIVIVKAQADDLEVFTAAEQGDLKTVEELITADSSLVTATDDAGYTPLHKAAYNNRPDVVEFLLSHGSNVDAASSSGSTALHGAAFYGYPEIVRLLLDHGAGLAVTNAGGYTPLLSASAGNRADIVQLLVERGADVNLRPAQGRTPLEQAVWNADADLTRFLLDNGAEVGAQGEMGVSLPFFATAFRNREFGLMLIDRAPDFGETDASGLSMLHYSAARGFADVVQKLLDRGVDADVADSLGRTPMFYALLWGHDETVSVLKERGAAPIGADQAWFRGDYLGRPAPGKTPAKFVGDELRTPFAPHGRIVFSPDGGEMLWCHHAMPIQAMWYSRQVDGRWQRPVIAPFTDPTLKYADGNPCFSADGSRIYYHTHRPLNEGGERKEDTDIWYVEKGDEGWGLPIPLGSPVNTDKYELAPMVAPSGNLYFIGNEYEDTYGTGDIYMSEYAAGAYSMPRNLGPAVNSEYHELSPVVPTNESYVVFASDRPERRQRTLQLHVSFRLNDNSWTRAVSLGRSINQGHTWHPVITADDKYIFYQQGADYHWFSTDLIDDIRQAVVGPGRVDAPTPIPALRKSEQVFEHAATNHIGLGDLDGDGDLDAVFSNMHQYGSRVYLNDGSGRFTATEQLLTQEAHGVDIGDLDADLSLIHI